MKRLASIVMALFLGTANVGVVCLDSQAAPRRQTSPTRVYRQNRLRPHSSRYNRRGYTQNRVRRGQERISPRTTPRPVYR
ncbi:hypothetical protein [Dendronalium sp. ChiSLP03b]|uniref:hypothetical protein n=1 Tax=Dendronalium sp. ChiSLP03b TaxID=3075381 RepID=UPI002AD247E9|nr:hypothetical protein [Dendronalium sp. ChiSLP03b]MDZ8203678.1 hypothetical protein [Dendronalium sp. ChiSLP03b]